MRKWWAGLSLRTKAGAVFAGIGAALTVLLAFLSSSDDPPSANTYALLVLLAILAQLGATWIFSGDGKADPSMARRSVARLVGLASRAEHARKQAELLTAKGTSISDLREGIGHLSVHLSYLEEGYVQAIEDWRAFHPRVVDAAEKPIERKSSDDE